MPDGTLLICAFCFLNEVELAIRVALKAKIIIRTDFSNDRVIDDLPPVFWGVKLCAAVGF